MARPKNRSVVPEGGPQPGAFSMAGIAPGQIPIWARMHSIRDGRAQTRSIRSGRASSAMRHQLFASPVSSPRPIRPLTAPGEMIESSTRQLPAPPPLSEVRPLPPSPSFSDIPPELRPTDTEDQDHLSNADSSSNNLIPMPDQSLPRAPSFSSVPPELRPLPNEGEDSSGMNSVYSGVVSKRNQSKRWRACLLFAVSSLLGVAIGVGIGVSQRNKNEVWSSTAQTRSDANEPGVCDFSVNNTVPSVFLQCDCDGRVSLWTREVEDQYNSLRQSFMPTLLPEFDEEEQSCDPTNTALWQLSNDTLFGVNVSDTRYLLGLLYANWDGENWRRRQHWFSVAVPECEWEGVGCNTEGQLRRLFLEKNNLGGTLPTELALMNSLQILDLESNRISGGLPTVLFQLQNLERVHLAVNWLTGPIPTVSLLPFLEVLDLDFNFLSGTIPIRLGNLFSLRVLGIGQNSFVGPLPSELGQLQVLENLRFLRNELTGTLPKELGNARSLRSLAGGYNSFRGQLPSQIGNLSDLRCLDLEEAGLAGVIPTELGQNTNLSTLSLSNNYFVGSIPFALNSLTQLTYVFLSGNGLSGTLPSELGTWTSLTVLEMDENFQRGSIPSEIGQLSFLAKLNLGGLDLSGSVPQQVCALRNGALYELIAPCTTSGVATNTFQCDVPDCCTECAS